MRNASGTFVYLRALLDSGSQISIISKSAADLLGLKTKETNLNLIGVNGDRSAIHSAVELELFFRTSTFACTTVAAVHRKLNQRHPMIPTGAAE